MKTRGFSPVAAVLVICASATTLLAQIPLVRTPPDQLTPQQLSLKPKAIDAPDIKVEVVKDFMKMAPNTYMGEGIGVAQSSKGNIYVNSCAQQTKTFEFDRNGTYLRELGKGMYGHVFCHGVRVDAQDNIW